MRLRVKLSLSDKERFLSVITSRLIRQTEIIFAYLYGSAHDELLVGDIDIAVYFKDYITPEIQNDITLSLTMELSSELGLPVDVRPLNQAYAGLRFHVTEGRVLFSGDEETRLEFVESTWREYLDFKPLMEQNLKDLLE
jgi:predicted nucleotidyltransferase